MEQITKATSKSASSQENKLEQEVARLKRDNLSLQSENASLQSKLTKDRHNSSKPSYTDGLKKKVVHLRKPSSKKPGS
ncbi:MAG: hypothetical protein AAF620_05740 [Bacteroidota bacterium]